MDDFLKLMTSDTVVFNYAVHNRILAVGGVVAIWTIVLLKDLQISQADNLPIDWKRNAAIVWRLP